MSNSSSSALKWLKLDKDDQSDIFYSCIVAIIASTLLALHLNISPPCPSPRPRHFLQRFWEAELVHHIRHQICWAIMVVIAPELLVSLAFGDWRAASQGLAVFQRFGRNSVRNWTRTHARFANMGGLRFKMARGGPDIPLATGLRADMDVSISSLVDFLVEQQMPLNRAMRKCKTWWKHLCSKMATVFPLIQGLKRADKGKEPAAPDDSPVRNSESSTGVVEMVDVTSDEVLSYRFDSDMVDSSDVALAYESQETEGPQAGPSTAQQTSIDLGQSGLPSRFNSLPNGHEDGEILRIVPLSDIETIRQHLDEHEQSSQQQSSSLQPENGTIFLYLNGTQIVLAQILGILDDVPEINEDTINDRSKTNALMKISAIIPLAWFVARIIVKKHLERSISQLELASSTYILCSFIAYLFYWSKPQGVERPNEQIVRISGTLRSVTDQDLDLLKKLGGSPFITRNFVPPFGMDGSYVEPTQPIPTGTSLTAFASFGNPGVAFFDDDFAGTLLGIIFGGLYFLGWNTNNFPSIIERLVWRIALVAVTGSLIPYSIANGVCSIIFQDLACRGTTARTHVIHSMTLYALLGIYVSGRLFMLVGMIREFVAL